MTKRHFGRYLKNLRIKSGNTTVSDYLKNISLKISEPYYRALENGDKAPSVETIEGLAKAIHADPYEMFQCYLEDILPSDVFKKLVSPVLGQSPAGSPKEELNRKKEILTTYRTALQKQQLIEEDTYSADDQIVEFLDEHFDLLPLVHFIYMKEGEASEDELLQICEMNGIKRDLGRILDQFRDNKIARIIDYGPNKRGRWGVQRFNATFRLPSTAKGRALRARWMLSEIERGLGRDRGDKIQSDKTYSHAVIRGYQLSKLSKADDHILDLIAQLNAATSVAEGDNTPFFVAIMISPRPEYSTFSSADGKAIRSPPRRRKPA